jgi:hypothetical protein
MTTKGLVVLALIETVAIALGVCCMMVAYFYFIGPSD